MALFAVLSFGILAIAPQVVFSLDFKFSLSEVKQCEPVSLTFVGNSNASAIPMWLSLVPFNSNPVSIPVLNAAANISGVTVTFVPFQAGTNFVASLNDARGENVARVSDVIRVLPSSTGNTSCLSDARDPPTPTQFTLNNSTFLQCETFSLGYNRRVVPQAPSVRLYSPRGPSVLLNLTRDNNDTGVADYMLSFERSKQVILVMSDATGRQESTAIMTVGGDSSSSKDCLGIKEEKEEEPNKVNAVPEISRAVVIGCSIGGGVIVLFAICILLFILRERRRRHPVHIEFDPSLLEKARTPTPMSTAQSPSPTSPFEEKDLSPGYVRNPPYTTAKFLSPTTSHYPRNSMASWSQPTPEDQLSPQKSQRASYASHSTNGRMSINALDIEGMLNLASVQSNRSSQLTAQPLGQVTRPLEVAAYGPLLTVPGTLPSRGHLRDPSDVPVAAFSASTEASLNSVVDPFADNMYGQVDNKPLAASEDLQNAADSIAKPPKVSLPSSPRDGPSRIIRERSSNSSEMWQSMSMLSPSSNRSSRGSPADHYGVAR